VQPSRTRRITLGLALSLALTAAACGDDDDTSTDTGDETTVPDADAAEVSVEACDAYVGLSGAMLGDPAAAGDLFAAFESTAPEDLADDAATVVATYTTLAEGGDPSAFAEPEYVAASTAVADAYFEGCDTVAELDVQGVDYGFEGLPAEVAAGRVALRFTNATEHEEPHELVLFQIQDGVTESIDELLALPEEEAGAKMAPAGVLFVDTPGAEAAAMLDLEPGRYAAVCFIPIGGGEDGAPHFTGGMVAELEVTQ
jgi:hypothetical protein